MICAILSPENIIYFSYFLVLKFNILWSSGHDICARHQGSWLQISLLFSLFSSAIWTHDPWCCRLMSCPLDHKGHVKPDLEKYLTQLNFFLQIIEHITVFWVNQVLLKTWMDLHKMINSVLYLAKNKRWNVTSNAKATFDDGISLDRIT